MPPRRPLGAFASGAPCVAMVALSVALLLVPLAPSTSAQSGTGPSRVDPPAANAPTPPAAPAAPTGTSGAGAATGASDPARASEIRGLALRDVVSAWTIARRWLDGYSLPREHEGSAAVVIPHAFGLSVVIRANGEIMGRGESAPVDGLSLRRAMAQAMGEAWGSGVRSLAESLGEATVGPRLTLELEVAAEPEPVLGRSFSEAAERIRPGLDGLAVRRGDRWAVAYAGRQLASNSARNPAATFAALAGQLNLPAGELEELRRTDDVVLYRLEAIRLVQLAEDQPPILLVRNDEYVPDSAVGRDSVARLAGAVGHRLVRTVPRERPDRASEVVPATASNPGGAGAALATTRRLFRGDYRPASDDYRPLVAPAFDQALAALALLRLADSDVPATIPEAPGLAAECRSSALNALEVLALNSAAVLRFGDREPLAEPRTAAATILAVLALEDEERTPWLNELLQVAVESLREARAATAAKAAAPEPRGTTAHARAVEAAALAAVHRADATLVPRPEAVAAADAAWAAAAADKAVVLLPWIVWAEQDLAAVGEDRPKEPLLALRDLLLASQELADVGTSEQGDLVVSDLRVGFRLVAAGASDGIASAPTAQSLRPAAGLAAMLADPHLTPDVVVAPLSVRQRIAARYMLQLAVRPPLERLYRRSDAVSGGVRNSTWDGDLPVAAQAMAILAALETLKALERADQVALATDSARGRTQTEPERGSGGAEAAPGRDTP